MKSHAMEKTKKEDGKDANTTSWIFDPIFPLAPGFVQCPVFWTASIFRLDFISFFPFFFSLALRFLHWIGLDFLFFLGILSFADRRHHHPLPRYLPSKLRCHPPYSTHLFALPPLLIHLRLSAVTTFTFTFSHPINQTPQLAPSTNVTPFL